MLTVPLLYFGFIVLMTGCGILVTRVGTTTGHLLASAVGAFACVLIAAAVTIALSLSSSLVSM